MLKDPITLSFLSILPIHAFILTLFKLYNIIPSLNVGTDVSNSHN